jgi:hypothetical protein
MRSHAFRFPMTMNSFGPFIVSYTWLFVRFRTVRRYGSGHGQSRQRYRL